MSTPDLFTPIQPAPAPSSRMVGSGIPLRFCQREDCDALTHALESGHNRIASIAATGYGKGAECAEMAGRLRKAGKVLALVDRAHLVHQLADEIERHLDGVTVGRVADGSCEGIQRGIVVGTVQAMYTPDRSDRPLYTYPQFKDVRGLIVDEGHKFFADCFRAVPDHFVEQNGAVVVGFTATPVASNGAKWASFFDWTPAAEGPCMRTVGWCVRNGYLVPPRQAFIRVNLDLAAIYNRLGTDEPENADDDSADDASAVLMDLLRSRGERDAASFAAGVVEVIGTRRAIIFTPPRRPQATDAPCKLLASWLKAAGMPCEAVWGGRGDVSDVLARFKRGEPQSLANVNLLCEGYDAPAVSAVFICRLLKQWRLVQQMVGRALRPHPSTIADLNAHDEPGEDGASRRRAALSASPKPDALVADLVGLDGKVLRASAIDVMHAAESEDVRMVMGEIVARRQRGTPDDGPQDDSLLEAARTELLARQHEQLAEQARRRGMAGDLPADVTVSYDDAGHGADLPSLPTPVEVPTVGERARFVAVATEYDVDRAVEIAERTSRNKLKGMTASVERKARAENRKPDWNRARQMYPEWQNAKSHAKVEAACKPATGPVPGLTIGQYGMLRRFGFIDSEIRKMGPEKSAAELSRFNERRRKGLCSLKQGRILRDAGYTSEQLKTMTQRRAHELIETVKQNGWRKPQNESLVGATEGYI